MQICGISLQACPILLLLEAVQIFAMNGRVDMHFLLLGRLKLNTDDIYVNKRKQETWALPDNYEAYSGTTYIGSIFKGHESKKVYYEWIQDSTAKQMRSALFCEIKQRIAVIRYRPTGCPETSVKNYHYTLRNFPEEEDLIFRGGNLKSCEDGAHLYLSLWRIISVGVLRLIRIQSTVNSR